jgi:hypothetical protein
MEKYPSTVVKQHSLNTTQLSNIGLKNLTIEPNQATGF